MRCRPQGQETASPKNIGAQLQQPNQDDFGEPVGTIIENDDEPCYRSNRYADLRSRWGINTAGGWRFPFNPSGAFQKSLYNFAWIVRGSMSITNFEESPFALYIVSQYHSSGKKKND